MDKKMTTVNVKNAQATRARRTHKGHLFMSVGEGQK